MARTQKNPLGWVQLGLMALSVGLSILAGKLLKPKNKSPISDDKPTTLTTRGSFTNWFLGIREVGPAFAWAGDREKRKEKVPGGKGIDSPKQDVWYEAGWHLLGVGPCDALLAIKQSGKVIFQGPITPGSHPSGSTVDLAGEGSFTIYWGEQGQPVNTFLGDAGRVGISSRWPRTCYVVWNKKRLGSSPVWPVLNYVVERRPSGAYLSLSQSWYEPTQTLNGPTGNIVARVANADPDVGYLEVDTDLYDEADPGRNIALAGNALANGDYVVRRAENVQAVIGTNSDGLPIKETHTRVYLETGTLGANIAGTLQTYTFEIDDGANIAHIVADLLFDPWPGGLGLDPDGPEPWDVAGSLEAWGQEAETLGLRSSLISVNGEEASSLLAACLQDHGVLLTLDTLNQGKLTFQRIREPSGTLPNISAELFSGPLPERETMHGEPNADKLVFKFTDREHAFGDMTIMVRDDGSVGYAEYARARDVQISTTVHFGTAAILAEQRSQEELGGAGKFTLRLSRGARELLPGNAITADTFDDVLRVLEVGVDPLSEEVAVEVQPDVYGVRRSDFVNSQGGGSSTVLDPEPDQFRFLEIPEALLGGDERLLISVPRIRAHSQTIEATIHLSADDTTYTAVGREPGATTGGVLDASISATADYYQAQGPTFTLVGPDAAGALDLTGDDLSWSRGRQLAVIVDADGEEVCFVRKLTALGGGQYRLDGLLRARYDTRRRAWSAGAHVFVFANDELQTFEDLLLVPAADLYVKSQPIAAGGSVPLSGISPDAKELYGKGLVPVTPEALRCTAPYHASPSYATGDNVTVRWGWSSSSSQNTGAGYQAAGAAIGAPTLKGSFIVELRTTGGTLVQTDTVQLPAEITYSNATLVAAPISEGSFKVRVAHTNNGYTSPFAELTVTKV